VVAVDQPFYRIFKTASIHPAGWQTFRSFGPLIGGRFDHHIPPKRNSATRAVLYGAVNTGDEAAIATCLVEVFQAIHVIDRFDESPYLAAFEPSRSVRLLDLRHRWPARAGATQALNSGPHSKSHRWSRKIYSSYPDIDGLLYPSAVAGIGGANVMLFERALDAIARRPSFNLPLSHIALVLPLRRAADRFGYDLV